MVAQIPSPQADASSEAMCLQLIHTPAGDLQLTNVKLRGMIIDAIGNADPIEDYNADFDCESTIELEPKPLSEIITLMQSQGVLDNLAEECATPDNAEEQIFDWIEDNLIDLCTKTEVYPDWIEKIRQEKTHQTNGRACNCEDWPLCEQR